MPTKKHKRFKRFDILLDEGLPLPNNYKQLNKFHSLKHIGRTKLKGAIDKTVYSYAKKEKRIFITFNIKDFEEFIKEDTPTIIALSQRLTNEKSDLKICKALRELKNNETYGHLISISNQPAIYKKKIERKNN